MGKSTISMAMFNRKTIIQPGSPSIAITGQTSSLAPRHENNSVISCDLRKKLELNQLQSVDLYKLLITLYLRWSCVETKPVNLKKSNK